MERRQSRAQAKRRSGEDDSMAEKTFVNCTGGGPIRVHVEDGKITKVRPLVFDETDAPSWVIEANGKKYSPPRKACVAPFTLTERARVYSEDRIMYPMKPVSYTHLRAHETDSYLVCRLLLEKK